MTAAGRRDGAPAGGTGAGSIPVRWPGIVAVAATYLYFLLWAQFGFLDLLQARLPTAGVQAALAAMGLAGLAASLITAGRLLGRLPPLRLLGGGLAAAAAGSLAPFAVSGTLAHAAAAAWIGGATGVLTVTLASHLRHLLPGRRYGLAVGAGTGVAYLLANLPPLFAGSSATRAAAAGAACLAGLAAVRRAAAGGGAGEPPPVGDALGRDDFRGLGLATAVASFLALVGTDSAAFAVIQESPELMRVSWGDPGRQLLQGGVHLLAALAAGRLIDRGHFRGLLLGAFALFAVAFRLFDLAGPGLALAAPLYAVGISVYSVALVAYPAYRPDEPGLAPRRWRAGLLFGIAGWLGSALGVGMAEELEAIPAALLWGGGAILALSWLAARRGATASGRSLAVPLMVGAAALLPGAVGRGPAGEPATTVATLSPPGRVADAAAVERGRRVYVAEGCIHCHSQYLRPGTRDTELWGPGVGGELAAEPPLLGNRRQGPDLSRVGARRSAAWHRLHLVDPRSLVPGSRMPSYAHLFAPDDPRGEDLAAYLASLGADVARARWEASRRADVPSPEGAPSPARGRRLFADYCAPCHGAGGRGDGPLAAHLHTAAMDLTKGDFWIVPWGAGTDPETVELARVVRWGLPGTSMPGHEYLTPRQVADLVAHVLDLRHGGVEQ